MLKRFSISRWEAYSTPVADIAKHPPKIWISGDEHQPRTLSLQAIREKLDDLPEVQAASRTLEGKSHILPSLDIETDDIFHSIPFLYQARPDTTKPKSRQRPQCDRYYRSEEYIRACSEAQTIRETVSASQRAERRESVLLKSRPSWRSLKSIHKRMSSTDDSEFGEYHATPSSLKKERRTPCTSEDTVTGLENMHRRRSRMSVLSLW